jgi:hypothetical protein
MTAKPLSKDMPLAFVKQCEVAAGGSVAITYDRVLVPPKFHSQFRSVKHLSGCCVAIKTDSDFLQRASVSKFTDMKNLLV